VRPRRVRGITLIELMVVVSLVAVLATLAAPAFRDFAIRNRSAAMANDFVGTVMRARNEAVSRNTCVVVCRSALTTAPPQCATGSADWRIGWMAFVDTTCAATNNAPADADVFMTAGPFDAQFSLVSNATNSDRFMFGPTGAARAGDAGRFDLQYLSETRASNRGICLSALGRARVIEAGGTC
jgi:type IV fimbrial biogenesis protein FimT